MKISQAGKLTRQKIKQITNSRSFRRGEDYFESGRVRMITQDQETFTAKVRGTRNYRVKIQIWEKEIEYSCDCPVGMEDVFCKHLVAAGLTWVEGENHKRKRQSPQSKPKVTTEDVRDYLLKQDKETLVRMLMEQTIEDDRLREQLFLKVAQKGPKGLDLATYRRAIDDSVDTGDFIDYRAMWDYCRKIEDVVEAVEELLKEGHAEEGIELTEYFMEAVEERLGEVDDSDGGMGGILERLQEIHHAACKKVKPNPAALAERLFEWELKTDYDTFYNAVKTYADVLGEKGIAHYRKLAEKTWGQVPQLNPSQSTSARYEGSRFRITHIMEALTEETGDIEALVAVKSRDLSDAYAYLSIAQIYQKAGNRDKTLEWAERGLKAFPQKTDSRLREFLAEEYHKRKRHDEAMSLMWAEFSERSSLGTYQKLKTHADCIQQWPIWRDKAIGLIRANIAKLKKEDKGYSLDWKPDHSLLVQIFLWEKDDQTAWQEAKAGGCSDHLWLELAKKCEKSHPGNALEVYQTVITPTIDQKHNAAYEEAVSYLCKIKEAMDRLNRSDEFLKYLESIRVAHKPKRNLMKLIDQLKW